MYPDTLPALVVTLTPLPKQWEAMIHRFAPHLRTHVLKKGTPYDFLHKPRSRTGEKLPFPDVILTSYSKLQGWAETFARMDAFRTLIGDECHELRHPGTQRYAAWQLIRSKVTYCLGTTGTPVYGMGSQIHHVINAIRPDALGTWSEFVRERCGAATDDKPVVKDPDALGEHLRREGLMLRRTTEEVGAELPPIQRLVQAIEIDDKPLRAVESRAQELAAIILASNATPFARMDASAEIDWRVRQATGIGKAPYVVEFIRMLLESGEKKVLVYAWHREVYALMAEAFKDLNPAFYTGSESQPQKEESKRRFVDGETPLLIMSLRSGAGLDGLQYAGCRVAVFAELDWSPAVHEQAECRIYRDGQPDPVLVYYLVADSGSDPFVMDVLGIKADQAHGIIDPNKARAATSREAQQAMRDRIRTMAASYAGKRGGDVERALSEAQMALPIEAEDGSVGCLHSV
jgi:SNF2 family DNA or RNA helicase